MPTLSPFRLSRSGAVAALVSAALAGEANAAAGRTEFTVGSVTVARGGVQRPLARGTELDNGDVVRTNDGRAQIRFTDGSYVSLQPNTEYGIRDYQYTQGNERGFFSLLKGAMRTVTGAIGRINRDRFQIATPTATVGIRGTGGVIQVQDDGSTLVVGTSGIWSLTNPAGSVDVPAGTSAVAPSDPNQPPQETTQQPASGPAPVPEEEPAFVAGEEVDEQGLPVIPTPVLTSGSGYGAAIAHDLVGAVSEAGLTTNMVFNAAGQMTEMTALGGVISIGSGSHAEFGTDGVLAWGRWIGQISSSLCGLSAPCPNYTANQGFHYVVGMPTPTMPTDGTTATYALLGATSPTYVDGLSPPGTFSGSLTATFSAQPTVRGSFNVSMPDGAGYQWQGTGAPSGPGGVFFMTTTILAGAGGSGGACTGGSGCVAEVSGFFAGANAERAGIGYSIDDLRLIQQQTISRQVVGGAAFQRQ
jgi:hypothetical protein